MAKKTITKKRNKLFTKRMIQDLSKYTLTDKALELMGEHPNIRYINDNGTERIVKHGDSDYDQIETDMIKRDLSEMFGIPEYDLDKAVEQWKYNRTKEFERLRNKPKSVPIKFKFDFNNDFSIKLFEGADVLLNEKYFNKYGKSCENIEEYFLTCSFIYENNLLLDKNEYIDGEEVIKYLKNFVGENCETILKDLEEWQVIIGL